MSDAYPETYQLKFCPFPPSYNTNSQYICFKYEKCCPQGCCYSYSFTYFQSWYFWMAIVVFFLIFYSASWYCKKLEIERKRRLRTQMGTGQGGFPHDQRSPRGNNGGNVDNLLECLVQTYRARNVIETRIQGGRNEPAPPKYQDAINMPRVDRRTVQVVQIHVNREDGTVASEDPPTYDDVTRGQRSGV